MTILGMIDLPLVFMATRWFRGIHPVSRGMETSMRVALILSLASFSALFILLVAMRKTQLQQGHLLSKWKMEIAMKAADWKLRWAHIPIQAIYRPGPHKSHFRGVMDTWLIAWESLKC